MKTSFSVSVEKIKKINDLPNSWNEVDYKAIIELCDFDDVNAIPVNELYDYMVLNLLELEPNESAELLLIYKLGTKLNKGQIQDISHDIKKDALWEEYQDMSLHEDLFNITSQLYKVYNGKFPKPEAVSVDIVVNAENQSAKSELQQIDESFICRLLADGMDNHSILKRLFHEKIEGGNFEEAKHIIWQYKTEKISDSEVRLHLITGFYWVDELQGVESYQSSAYND